MVEQIFEPDEFDFNFLDYHGKFMLNSDKTWIVQCDRPVKVDLVVIGWMFRLKKRIRHFNIPDIRLLLMVLL